MRHREREREFQRERENHVMQLNNGPVSSISFGGSFFLAFFLVKIQSSSHLGSP